MNRYVVVVEWNVTMTIPVEVVRIEVIHSSARWADTMAL